MVSVEPVGGRGPRGATRPAWIVAAIAGVAALVAFAYVVVKLAPEWLASDDSLGPADRAEEIGRVRTALLALLAGLVAVAGAVFTGLTWRLNQRGQITDRFSTAVDQLGNESPDVREGGIYALEQIARDAPRTHHDAVMAVLTAYVRAHAPWRQPASQAANDPARPASDVQAAMTVIGRRDPVHDRQVLNLEEVDLRGVAMADANLRRTLFSGSHLEQADLIRADLREAVMPKANLRAASLHGARLDGANLVWAHLQSAILWRAELRGVHWQGAHLESAQLGKATLDDAPTGPPGMPQMQWVTFSEATEWPDGFSSQAAIERGARPVESMSADEVARAYQGLPPVPDHLLHSRPVES